jgi:hypothetical protein
MTSTRQEGRDLLLLTSLTYFPPGRSGNLPGYSPGPEPDPLSVVKLRTAG